MKSAKILQIGVVDSFWLQGCEKRCKVAVGGQIQFFSDVVAVVFDRAVAHGKKLGDLLGAKPSFQQCAKF